MRVLFTFAGGLGHWHPMVPVARAAASAGHTVAVACGPSMVAAVQAAGFAALPVGSAGGSARTITPLLELDAAREERHLRERFAGRLARERSPAVLDLCAAWRPDLVVSDEADFGSTVAAERLALPHATVLVDATGSFVRPGLVAEPLHELRAAHGLPPDPRLAMLSRYLVLVPFPPSLRDPAVPLPATAHPVRPQAAERGPDDRADVVARRGAARSDDTPTVYLTLGTVFNTESGDLFWRLLAGLRDLPVTLLATVGPQIDPGLFGPQPANVRLERYIPQAQVLPRCRLVVSHGGSGSVVGALAHGLPSVLLPMGADQPTNARRCEQLGVARVLDAVQVTPAEVGHAAAAVLADGSYRRSAERMRDEIADLPDAAHAVTLLERLAADRRPVVGA